MATTRADGVYVPKSFNLGAEDIGKLEKDVQKSKKAGKKSRMAKAGKGRGVVYLGHIPAGFYEPQMRQFFSQFGRITRLRLSRSKKTGKSKGYAFIEFLHGEVAQVVADTMNNYLMFMRLLKCQFLPAERVHADTFKGCKRKFSAPKAAAVAAKRHNSVKSPAQEKRTRGRLAKKLQKMVELGVLSKEEKIAQSPVPEVVNTPKGKLQVLKEDASDTEVTFKTPPGAIKSSRLAPTPKPKKKLSQRKKTLKRLKK